MSRLIPLGSIPDSLIFPDVVMRMKTVSLEAGASKENEAEGRKAKLMYILKLKVVEPKQFAGMPYTHRFTVGTEDDPDAELLETWQASFGGRGIKRFTKVIGVPFGDEEDEATLCKQTEGTEFVVTMAQKTDDGKRDARRKGQPFNDITAWWAIGEKDPGLIGDAPARSGATTRGAAKASTAATSQPKDAPTEDVTCTACKKRVPKAGLKAHVDQHMKDLAKSTGGGEGDEE